MPTTRDQLIADWRKRLDAASEAPEEPTSRAAWLVRLRIRLYRFLLSLYGEGDWNAPAEAPVRRRSPDPAAAATAGLPLDLSGKPAKDASIIRAALSSFAGAAETTPQPGPLAAGADLDAWITVASTSCGLDPERTAAALLTQGIISRVISHQRDVTVEVRACHLTAAEQLIDSQRRRLTVRPGPTQVFLRSRAISMKGDFQWSLLFLGLGVAPVAAFFVLLILGLARPDAIDRSLVMQFLWLVAYIWLGSFALIGLVYLFVGLRRKSRPPSSR